LHRCALNQDQQKIHTDFEGLTTVLDQFLKWFKMATVKNLSNYLLKEGFKKAFSSTLLKTNTNHVPSFSY